MTSIHSTNRILSAFSSVFFGVAFLACGGGGGGSQGSTAGGSNAPAFAATFGGVRSAVGGSNSVHVTWAPVLAGAAGEKPPGAWVFRAGN